MTHTTNQSEADRNIIDVIQGVRSSYACATAFLQKPRVICAGSFNPVHSAHLQLLKLGEAKTGLAGIFELSITNVDKPPLNLAEIHRRMRQFEKAGLALVLTNRPRYLKKIELFPPGSCFVMGADTFERLVDLRYYNAPESPLERFESRGTRFIVAPRRQRDGVVQLPEDILQKADQSDRWAKLTLCISRDEFLMDISSTDLRKAGSSPV